MTNRESAEQRASAFINAIARQEYGRCPKPPARHSNKPLDIAISSSCFAVYNCNDEWVVSVDVSEMNVKEVRYCLMVARKLGYNPKW